MKKILNAVFCYGVALTGFSQSWDLQDYKFRSLFETDTALFSVIQDSWGISYDNGVTWTYNTLDIEEEFSPVWIGFFDENYGLIGLKSGTGNYVLKTEDGGNNWTVYESFTPQYWSSEIYHVSDGTFIIKASQGSAINITFDYGVTWERVTFPNAGYTYLAELNIFGDVVYHRTGKEIYKSTDGAQSWNPVYSRSSDDMITFSFINEDIGYLITSKCCDDHNILKTTNGGTTWQESETNITGTVSALLFISESRGFIVDNENGWIMESKDGGETWIKNTPFDIEPYLSLRTSNSAFIYGRDAFKFNPEGSALGISSKMINIYPNPTNDLVKLDFKYEDYKIIDLSGKVIVMGAYSKNGINVSSLPSGEYILLLTMDDKVQASRFIKSK